jgi:hypothetical protein
MFEFSLGTTISASYKIQASHFKMDKPLNNQDVAKLTYPS